MDISPKQLLSALILLTVLVGSAAAQSKAKVSTGAAKSEAASEAPQAAQVATEDAAPVKTPVKSGEPEGNGKWVPRVDKKTCPNGSVAYVDEANGGVKCWVNTN